MAAGVGKTYRMLAEGTPPRRTAETSPSATWKRMAAPRPCGSSEGLEVIPRRTVVYGGKEVEEMDLPAILARAPELCLIDELAHTNPAGIEHQKRFEDVAEVLAAGIDVFSTVNVQHLESLNDQVAELTGRARARDAPGRGHRGRGRGRPGRPDARGAPEPLARGEGLSRPEDRRGARGLLQDREPPVPPRGCAPPGRRRGRG